MRRGQRESGETGGRLRSCHDHPRGAAGGSALRYAWRQTHPETDASTGLAGLSWPIAARRSPTGPSQTGYSRADPRAARAWISTRLAWRLRLPSVRGMTPTRLGPYRLLEPVTAGALTVTYRAEHEALGHRVLIKTL